MTHRRRLALVSGAALGSLAACHGARPRAEVAAPLCAPPAVVEAQTSGRLRIDGPGAWGPRLGDSVVVVINGVEWWRGVYAACGADNPPPPPPPGRAGARRGPAIDSVESVVMVRGDSARLRYRIGGKSPTAVVVQTRRAP